MRINDKLRERLVGAAVLISLAVIFLPELLRPPPDRPAEGIDLRMPPAPEITALPPPAEPVPVPQRVEPEPEQLAEPRDDTLEPDVPAEAGAPLEVPRDLSGWVVQVGAFAQQANALRLRDELRAKGFSAYVDDLVGQNRTLYRVRVGPELQRSRAEASLADIREQFGLEPRLHKHP